MKKFGKKMAIRIATGTFGNISGAPKGSLVDHFKWLQDQIIERDTSGVSKEGVRSPNPAVLVENNILIVSQDTTKTNDILSEMLFDVGLIDVQRALETGKLVIGGVDLGQLAMWDVQFASHSRDKVCDFDRELAKAITKKDKKVKRGLAVLGGIAYAALIGAAAVAKSRK
jgi:hypothetical protein